MYKSDLLMKLQVLLDQIGMLEYETRILADQVDGILKEVEKIPDTQKFTLGGAAVIRSDPDEYLKREV